jgi:hypothetical protein
MLPSILAVAAGAVLLSAVAAFAQAPAGDSAVGSALTGPRGSQLVVDAHSGSSGENPSGTVDVQFGFFTDVDAQVVCLSVSGNYAVVGFMGTYTVAFPTEPPRSGPFSGIVQIVDNGPAVAGISPDLFAEHDAFDSTTPPDCSAAGARPVGTSQTFGDFVVTDAPALPTTKDQCKNGGWRSFGVFKNQGDCVSFVATGGNNPPAGP